MRARGPYYRYERERHYGTWLFNLRRQRGMTQAQYAAFIGVSLRTLVKEEKSTYKHPPGDYTVMGQRLACTEFSDRWVMLDNFRRFVGGEE